jgi:predicted pyridoxine 5'-phosphate oxidase superfamily flavin-nucleotide-binding protein
MPVELTDEMREAFANAVRDGAPVLIASASASGMPDIAFKGSAMVWDKDHVAFWERARGQTMRNLEENGQACLLYRNTQTRVAWKFFGKAEVLQSGPLREEIMARTVQFELDRDPDRNGAAVLIRIDRVLQAGQVLMERED